MCPHHPSLRGQTFETRRAPACAIRSPKPEPPGASPGRRARFQFSDECRSFVRGKRRGRWRGWIMRRPPSSAEPHVIFQNPGRLRTQRVSYARLSWCKSTSRNHCRVAKRKGNGLISRPRAGSIPAPATSFCGPRKARNVAKFVRVFSRISRAKIAAVDR